MRKQNETYSGGGRYVRGSYILVSLRLRATKATNSMPRIAKFVTSAVMKVWEELLWALAEDTSDIA